MRNLNLILDTLFVISVITIALLISGFFTTSDSAKSSDIDYTPGITQETIQAFRLWDRETGITDWQIERNNHVENIRNVGSN